MALQWKSLHYVKDLDMEDRFITSPGWISNALTHYGKVGVNLHGEASEFPSHLLVDLRKLSVSDLLAMMHCQCNTKTKRMLGSIGPSHSGGSSLCSGPFIFMNVAICKCCYCWTTVHPMTLTRLVFLLIMTYCSSHLT